MRYDFIYLNHIIHNTLQDLYLPICYYVYNLSRYINLNQKFAYSTTHINEDFRD